jgi:hypothetical protein
MSMLRDTLHIVNDETYGHYTGQRFTVVRPLIDGVEIDEADTGPMYEVRTEGGAVLHVFADEIEHDN